MPNQWPINEKFPNHVDLSKVNIGFATDRILCELKGSKKLSEKQVSEFRMSCKAFLIKMVKKLVDKSPLTYPESSLQRKKHLLRTLHVFFA